MLEELRIQNLGVIEELSLVLPGGSIAITGETGAGKTMVVGAIQLLMGGRADPDMVRVGADEATIEGRFVGPQGEEVIARRVIPSDGRSRAYLDGSLATATALQDRIGPLIDVHSQHSRLALLKTSAQRAALDRFGTIDDSALEAARAELSDIDSSLADLGGDERERAREIDLLSYQLAELEAAQIVDPGEAEQLLAAEERLANAYEYQLAAREAADLLGGDGPAVEALTRAAMLLGEGQIFAEVLSSLSVAQDEFASIASLLRNIHESTVDDPAQRETVRQRLQLLVEMRRKYGPSLDDVIAYTAELSERLSTLESHEERVASLTHQREAAVSRLDHESAGIAAARSKAAEPMARAIESELASLAMQKARVEVAVRGNAGDDVEVLLAANPGLPLLPVGKNASGGELSRTMLALRLVLAEGPPIVVLDEVDAGIGGRTARAVGTALASLGDSSQVFVVTHLAQVAASASHHVVIDKTSSGAKTVSQARLLDEQQRVVEVSRMLSGSPDSSAARDHAEELLGQSQDEEPAATG